MHGVILKRLLFCCCHRTLCCQTGHANVILHVSCVQFWWL